MKLQHIPLGKECAVLTNKGLKKGKVVGHYLGMHYVNACVCFDSHEEDMDLNTVAYMKTSDPVRHCWVLADKLYWVNAAGDFGIPNPPESYYIIGQYVPSALLKYIDFPFEAKAVYMKHGDFEVFDIVRKTPLVESGLYECEGEYYIYLGYGNWYNNNSIQKLDHAKFKYCEPTKIKIKHVLGKKVYYAWEVFNIIKITPEYYYLENDNSIKKIFHETIVYDLDPFTPIGYETNGIVRVDERKCYDLNKKIFKNIPIPLRRDTTKNRNTTVGMIPIGGVFWRGNSTSGHFDTFQNDAPCIRL